MYIVTGHPSRMTPSLRRLVDLTKVNIRSPSRLIKHTMVGAAAGSGVGTGDHDLRLTWDEVIPITVFHYNIIGDLSKLRIGCESRVYLLHLLHLELLMPDSSRLW